MELDAMKRLWEEHDRKLDVCLRLNLRLLQAPLLNQAESALRRLSWLLAVDLILNLAVVAFLGAFIARHWTEPHFFGPAAWLDLGAILLAGSAIRQLVAIAAIDWSAPLVAIQKRLESLRIERLRALKWTLLCAPLLWILVLIVGLKATLGVSAYALFPAAWLVGNILFGLAFIPLAVWVARWCAPRMERSPRARRFLHDLAGRNLSAALGFLQSVERFESEA